MKKEDFPKPRPDEIVLVRLHAPPGIPGWQKDQYAREEGYLFEALDGKLRGMLAIRRMPWVPTNGAGGSPDELIVPLRDCRGLVRFQPRATKELGRGSDADTTA